MRKCDDARDLDERDRKARESGFIDHASMLAARKLEAFNAICPPLYQNSELSYFDRSKLDRIMAWQYGSKGLILHGESGKGKTRLAWLLLRKIVLEHRKTVECYDGIKLAEKTQEAYKESQPDRLLNSLGTKDILFLDDLGKIKITQRVGEMLFGMVERRSQYMKPVIITTNFTGESLLKRFEDPETGIPFLRRVREFCESISF